MNMRFGKRISQLNQAHRRKKWWHNLVVTLAILVVFCTTYSLIMNAITLEVSPDPDPNRFTVNGAEIPGEFVWQDPDAGLTVAATLHGNASYVGTLPKDLSPELLVEFDDEEATEWLETYESDDMSFPLLAFRLRLRAGDAELLLGNCRADVTLTMRRELFETAAMAIGGEDPNGEPSEEPSLALIATDVTNGQTQLAAAELGESVDPVLTFTIRANATTAVEAASNPAYTLQHYLYFPEVVTSANGALAFIDTSQGHLQEIPETPGVRGDLALQNTLNMNAVNVALTAEGALRTNNVLKRLFVDEETNYRENPQINYMSRLYNRMEDFNTNYTLGEIWVYTPQDGAAPGQAVKDAAGSTGYTVYEVPDAAGGRHAPERVRFTNNPNNRHIGQKATEAYPYDVTIYIPNNAIIRLVFAYTEDRDIERGANFFDYDVTDGYVYTDSSLSDRHNTGYQQNYTGTLYAYTNAQGINSPANYDPTNSGVKLVMGNTNIHPGNSTVKFKGYYINRSNDNVYQYCSFGLASGLTYDEYGIPIPQFADGISAPDLFSLTERTGKTSYQSVVDGTLQQQYSLGFYRQGGTYTLSYVKDNKTNKNSVEKLRYFQDLRGNVADPFYSNEFWPMDGSASHGTDGHDLFFGKGKPYETKRISIGYEHADKAFPITDYAYFHGGNGTDRNAFFGMSFTVDFTLDPGYIAPLDYWFYGDDDMWVFLDELNENGEPVGNTKLVADIGGIHSSAGEYVNLWEYVTPVGIDETESKAYRLTFFYTERGASGSTCYMRFTVPLDVRIADSPFRDEAIVIEKVVIDSQGDPLPYDPNGEKYFFELTMITADGASYEDIYDYAIYLRTDGSDHTNEPYIRHGTLPKTGDEEDDEVSSYYAHDGPDANGDDTLCYTFYLRNGEYIVITNLPDDTHYTIRELRAENASFVTQYQKGTHMHIDGAQVDALEPAIRYDYVAGDPERINADEHNYVRFTNGPVIKTEVSPGDGESVHIGEEIIYDIEWGNDTHGDAAVTITDVLDPGVDLVGVKFVPTGESTDYRDRDWLTVYNGMDRSITYDPLTRTVTWNLDSIFRKSAQKTIRVDGILDDTGYIHANWITDGLWQNSSSGGPVLDDLDVGYTVNSDDTYVYLTAKVNRGVEFLKPPDAPTDVQTGSSHFRIWICGDGMEARTFYDLTWDGEKFAAYHENYPTENLDFAETHGDDYIYLEVKIEKAALKIDNAFKLMVSYSTPYCVSSNGTYGYNTFFLTASDELAGNWWLTTDLYQSYTCEGTELGTYEDGTSGLVSLKVRVNADAAQAETTPGKFGTLNPRVENQASIKVGNQNAIRTNIVENPIWGPFKTEPTPGDKAPVVQEDTITYTITWRNYKSLPNTVTVRDPLDPSVQYVEGSAKAFYGTYGEDGAAELTDIQVTYDAETHELVWELGKQLPGADGYVIFEVTVDPAKRDVTKGNRNTDGTVIRNWGYVQVGDEPEIETNRISNPIYGYWLPETGGVGSAVYVLVGLLLIGSAAAAATYRQIFRKRKRR